MATRIIDARDRQRGSIRAVSQAPYAGRGAGLYNEVDVAPLYPPIRSPSPLANTDEQPFPPA